MFVVAKLAAQRFSATATSNSCRWLAVGLVGYRHPRDRRSFATTSSAATRFLADSPNTALDKSVLQRYKSLDYDQDRKVQVTYLWIDGTGEHIRLKDRILDKPLQCVEEVPKWVYDGSSTYQAQGENSDTYLQPRAIYRDPFKPGRNDVIVMCDTYGPDGKPTATNHRNAMQEVIDQTVDQKPWFGIEQEYTLLDINGRPLLAREWISGSAGSVLLCGGRQSGVRSRFGRSARARVSVCGH